MTSWQSRSWKGKSFCCLSMSSVFLLMKLFLVWYVFLKASDAISDCVFYLLWIEKIQEECWFHLGQVEIAFFRISIIFYFWMDEIMKSLDRINELNTTRPLMYVVSSLQEHLKIRAYLCKPFWNLDQLYLCLVYAWDCSAWERLLAVSHTNSL